MNRYTGKPNKKDWNSYPTGYKSSQQLNDAENKKAKAVPLAYLLGAMPVVALLALFAWTWGLNVLHWFTASWRESTAFWFFAFIALIVASIAIRNWSKNDGENVYNQDRYYFKENNKAASKPLPVAPFVLIAIGLFITAIIMAVSAPYNIAREYLADATTVESVAPSYSERAPFEVAQLTARSSLQDTTGEALTSKALSDLGEHGYWNTLILSRGIWVGYESVQNLNLPLFGTISNQDVQTCDFNKENTLRHSGSLPHNNLSRAIFGLVPLNVDFEAGDAYGYCNEKGEPVVVTPLKEINGFFFPTWTAYGVAVYNGQTGELEIIQDADKLAEIPGPVYPMSLAESQRNSLTASGDWIEYTISRVSGYEAASSNTEVQLRQLEGGQTDYVTTLTPRGASRSIVAVSTVEANMLTPGERNTITIHKLPQDNIRVGNSTLLDNIITRYSYLPELVAPATQFFEITAWVDGGWVVSIGREQSVNYRAYVTATEEITLVDRNGNIIPVNGGNPVEPNTPGEPTVPPVIPNGDLTQLTDEQLTELGKAILDELARRNL